MLDRNRFLHDSGAEFFYPKPVPSKMRKRGLTEVTEGKVEANQGKSRVNEDEGVRMSVETVSA